MVIINPLYFSKTMKASIGVKLSFGLFGPTSEAPEVFHHQNLSYQEKAKGKSNQKPNLHPCFNSARVLIDLYSLF
jgi:hypothetical protein